MIKFIKVAQLSISVISIILLTFCSQNPSSKKQVSDEEISKYLGDYLYAYRNDETGEIQIEENCWTGGLDEFQFENIEGEGYYFAFAGHHVYSYGVQSSIVNGDTLLLSAIPEYAMEEEPEEVVFKMYFDKMNVLCVQEKGSSPSLFIPENDRDNFPFVACEDEEEDEESGELAALEEDIRLGIINILLSIEQGEEEYIEKIIPPQGIQLMTPGPGLHPYIDTILIFTNLAYHEIFTSQEYLAFLDQLSDNYSETHGEDYVFVTDELPDPCMPEETGLFIKFTYNDEGNQIEKVEATLVLYSALYEEIYRHFTLLFECPSEEEVLFSQIDARDCGA